MNRPYQLEMASFRNEDAPMSRHDLSTGQPERVVSGERQWLPVLIICVALAVLIFLVFGRTFHYPFINLDDQEYVYGNPEITAGLTSSGIWWVLTHAHVGNWHPLTSISHMLDCQIYGLDAGGHHFTNVLLHACAAVLLFLALYRMTGALWRCAFVAAVFAIHPLRVESVAWIAERKDVLSAVFFALTLLAYASYVRRPSIGRYVVISIALCLGLLSKPMLVSVPLVLLLLDYWPLRRMVDLPAFRKLMVEKIPLLAVAAGSVVATLIAQTASLGSIEELPLSWRLENAVVSYVIYLRQTFWPVPLAIFYPHTDGRVAIRELILTTAFLFSLTVLAWVLRKRRPYLLTGWMWFCIMLAPVIGIVQVGQQGHADRYTYLPQIGLLLALTWLVSELAISLRFRQQILTMGATIAIAALAWGNWIQLSLWRDSELLWAHALAVTSHNAAAHSNLADLLLRSGRVDEAIVHCQEALRIRPRNADAENNLGLALWQSKQPAAAVSHYERSLAMSPHNFNAEGNLAWVLATSPDPSLRNGDRAIDLVKDVIDRAGHGNPILLRTLGAAYAETGRFPEAIETAQQALQMASAEQNVALVADLKLNIANYRQNLPLRDLSVSESVSIPPSLARPR